MGSVNFDGLERDESCFGAVIFASHLLSDRGVGEPVGDERYPNAINFVG